MKWILIVIIFGTVVNLTAQKIDTLHVACTPDLTIVVPSEYRDTIFNYEEGFFKTFFWENGNILDIQCGSMAESNYTRDTFRYERIQVCENKQAKTVTGIEKKTGRCWGHMKIKNSRVKVSYICLPKEKNIFEKILQSILLE